jgi:hypothetical protein
VVAPAAPGNMIEVTSKAAGYFEFRVKIGDARCAWGLGGELTGSGGDGSGTAVLCRERQRQTVSVARTARSTAAATTAMH